MQKVFIRFITCCSILAMAGTFSFAQDVKKYPGAKLDERAGRQASLAAKGLECEVYTTPDGFDKVYAFYKASYIEFPTPFPTQKLPNGQEVKWAFFILDGGKDLAHSRFWLKIQRPYIGTIGDGDVDYKNIRDVSVIQTVHASASAGLHHFLEL